MRTGVDDRAIEQWLTAFDRLRQESRELLEAYADRLSRLAPRSERRAVERPYTGARGQSGLAKMWTRSGAWTAMCGVKILFRLPGFWRQKRHLDRLRARAAGISPVVVAIALRRLAAPLVDTAPRRYLSSLANSIDPGVKSPIAREVSDAEILVVCDPVVVSSLWRSEDRCRRDGVLIVDAGFLVFLAFLSAFRAPGRARLSAVSSILRPVTHASGHGWRSRCRLAIAAAAVEGLSEAFHGTRDLKAVFFTSNAFLTELLRSWLGGQARCTEITEVLHGVPTEEWRRYLESVIKAADCRSKHFFVPQVPSLPLEGIFASPPDAAPGLAINAAFNRRVYGTADGAGGIRGEVQQALDVLKDAGCLVRDCLIVSFAGGAAHDRNYLQSTVFKAECVLLSMLTRALLEYGRRYVIVYNPHPSHAASSFESRALFHDEHVLVHSGTLAMWFVADICVSLLSSTLFEATRFGVVSFTPAIQTDGLYRAELLGMLRHPPADGAEPLSLALRQAIRSGAERARDIEERAFHRLARAGLHHRQPVSAVV